MQPIKYKNYIDGEYVESLSGEQFLDINPANINDILGSFQSSTREDAKKAISAALEAQEKWAETPPGERGRILIKASEILDSMKEDLITILTREEGKTLNDSRVEVNRAVSLFRFYGVLASRIHGESLQSSELRTHLITVKEPVGVVSVITPWNFPIAIPSWKIAPALACGNTVVFKPASYTPLIGYMLVEALVKAGIPKGVINYVTGSGSTVGLEMITNKNVDAITFTGSLEVGEEIRRQSALAGKNIRIQLELGGKNPAIILPDANIDKAVEMVARGAFGLTGQVCTATSRAIVLDKVAEEFTRKIVEKAKKLRVGNGLREGVDLGPVVGQRELDKVLSYIEIGMREGAKLLTGGRRLTGGEYDTGYFVEPTVFADVTPDMRIAKEEIFGPVLAIMVASSLDEAIEIANSVDYGLAASIFTNSLDKAFEFISRIKAGVVKINKPTTGIEIQVPFGGYKKSSTETFRELGEAVIEFYTKTKTIYIGY
ncbi:MAG: aldehyde dehydrogenase family protein [Nitrososphaerota archaeon]